MCTEYIVQHLPNLLRLFFEYIEFRAVHYSPQSPGSCVGRFLVCFVYFLFFKSIQETEGRRFGDLVLDRDCLACDGILVHWKG